MHDLVAKAIISQFRYLFSDFQKKDTHFLKKGDFFLEMVKNRQLKGYLFLNIVIFLKKNKIYEKRLKNIEQ